MIKIKDILFFNVSETISLFFVLWINNVIECKKGCRKGMFLLKKFNSLK